MAQTRITGTLHGVHARGPRKALGPSVAGLAASIGEALEAADRLGRRADVHADIERTLTDADGAFLHRLIEGSPRHAARRADEMAAAAAMLEELDVEPRVAAASEAWLRSLLGRDG